MQKYCTPKICPLPTRVLFRSEVKNERHIKIIEFAANYYGLTVEQIKSNSRIRPICDARSVTMYILRAYTKFSLKEIGDMFGSRDHTTVIHAVRSVNNMLETDPNFAANYMALVELLKENNVIK